MASPNDELRDWECIACGTVYDATATDWCPGCGRDSPPDDPQQLLRHLGIDVQPAIDRVMAAVKKHREKA